ncbi:hypothetical protein BOTCAL_0317g00050 [Botryotinia calthae]|uniref:Uncharacterized protein n=1 Tax=Botryotinia calthae TaxID=38488 RepID=A0A4Y8CWI1_9HELO|nr:hypothetical protein BOTCAL_0317g00050 [Botryotinia calthae]
MQRRSDDDFEFAGYDCQDTPDWNQPPAQIIRPNSALIFPALLKLPDIVYDSPVPTSSAKPELSCGQKDASETPGNVFWVGIFTNFYGNIRETRLMELDELGIAKANPIPLKAAKLVVSNPTNIFGRTPPPYLNSISGGKVSRTGTQTIQFLG